MAIFLERPFRGFEEKEEEGKETEEERQKAEGEEEWIESCIAGEGVAAEEAEEKEGRKDDVRLEGIKQNMAVGKNEDFEDFGCHSLCYWHSRFF